MILFEEALSITMDAAKLFGEEKVPYLQSVGRVLSDDLFADISMPPFDKSAMDGYACKRADLHLELSVIETIRAGVKPEKEVGTRECSQIMTGAIVPKGADTVIMVEQTEQGESGKILFTGEKTSSNICYLGEDVNKGDLILKKGTLLSSRHIPLLATIGVVSVPVYKQTRVGVIATGTELVEPDQIPGISQIRNSNASQMMVQLSNLGFEPMYFGIAPDDEDETYHQMLKALQSTDVLILSGGVSMGEFDFVPSVLKRLGMEIKYQRIAVQPGKPTTFAVGKEKYVFALPGNPVSAFIQFEILVKPFLLKCMGHDWNPTVWKLPVGKQFLRKKTERMSWVPVKLSEEGKVIPLDYHGSAHIFSLNNAQGFIYFKIGQSQIDEGEIVHVRPV